MHRPTMEADIHSNNNDSFIRAKFLFKPKMRIIFMLQKRKKKEKSESRANRENGSGWNTKQ